MMPLSRMLEKAKARVSINATIMTMIIHVVSIVLETTSASARYMSGRTANNKQIRTKNVLKIYAKILRFSTQIRMRLIIIEKKKIEQITV